jgi:hypothetical protein
VVVGCPMYECSFCGAVDLIIICIERDVYLPVGIETNMKYVLLAG